MSFSEFNFLGVDVFKILRIENNATPNEVYKRYKKLKLLFHPDKISRPLTQSERNRNDDIQSAYDLLKEDFAFSNTSGTENVWANKGYHKRVKILKYDSLGSEASFQCHSCPNMVNRWSGIPSDISLRWFCSPVCMKTWENEKGYAPDTHGYTEPGGPPPPSPNTTVTTRKCPGCGYDRPFYDEGKGWVRYSLNTEFCCTEYCLETYLWSTGIDVVKCNFRSCHKIKREGDIGEWVRDPANRKNIYCCTEHLVQEITSGDSGLGTGGTSDPLQADRTTAITEIENTLRQPPPILNFELESTNQNWRNKIQNAPDAKAIGTIKTQALLDIKNKRAAKEDNDDITSHKAAAVAKIKAELSKSPEVKNSELEASNQGWENEIQTVADKIKVNQIESRVLADIRNQRAKKEEKGRLDSLLSQAKEQKNWDNYQNLENIFQQIKDLRSSNVYQDKDTEIQTIENRLRELAPDKFDKTVEELLNRQLRNNKLTDRDLNNEAIEAIAEAKRDPTKPKIEKAENIIATCGARKELKDILNKAAKVQTTQQKKELIKEIWEFITKNDFSGIVYKEQKSEVDNLLATLSKSSPSNQDQNSEFPWTKVLGITVLITLPIILIGFFVLKIHQGKKKKRKKIISCN